MTDTPAELRDLSSSVPEVAATVPTGAYRLPTHSGDLDLMSDGSVFDPLSRTLLMADVHVGKAEVFRRGGLPVPASTSGQTLKRLTASIAACQPKHLLVLGDLVHGRLPSTHSVFDELADWRAQHQSVTVHLLRGNHDHHAGDPPSRCNIEIWPDGKKLGAWQLCHEPEDAKPEAGIALCGHVHPVVRLRQGPDAVRVRCFWWQSQQLLVLPAFGAFTGGYAISPSEKDHVFLLDGQAVRALPGGLVTRSRYKRHPKRHPKR
ncbi:MAG: ligase-associated DNA damage response endonuclease PdeM [Burkholderiaceae bacterium]